MATRAVIGFDIAGVGHDPAELVIFAIGWALGWLLLWHARPLPHRPPTTSRTPVAVVIPARNEAHALPHLLRPLVAQRRAGDEIIVVDDDSDDGTARVARAFDVDVISAPPLPDGWLGKPNACSAGARHATADTLVFLDADVQPSATLLDDLAAAVDEEPDSLVSMQPWHRMHTVGEQPSLLCNVTALMGSGAFTPLGSRAAATVAFGPVIAVSRAAYESAGGHADPTVRAMHTEDIGLARAVGRSRLFVGRPEGTTFRMYPAGFRELVSGWSRSIATGARFTPWWIGLATAAWVWSLAGGWIAAPLVYPLSAAQVWVLGRRAGTTHPVAALFYPLLVVVFVAIFVRSAVMVVFRRDVGWKGRRVSARTD
ncbi:glycosyltransferase [Ilumatobacter coccineus]|uniref:Glycosyltransferase n=1 Tax=Ilumatobacter coccineus (strain NBRC 103263 / KCTC 29153 / YM16-304) TaxID=1313172 RepID=A0A6C7EHZ3_ILUCY|nr:glycosyltransferase [Ilumatobacter coccineus]BAN04168.1 glycosyltransferase [Ilumatobacter coccineus YM16-304]